MPQQIRIPPISELIVLKFDSINEQKAFVASEEYKKLTGELSSLSMDFNYEVRIKRSP